MSSKEHTEACRVAAGQVVSNYVQEVGKVSEKWGTLLGINTHATVGACLTDNRTSVHQHVQGVYP